MFVFLLLFACLLVFSSLMIFASSSIVFSVLWMAASFFNAAGMIMITGYDFIAMMLIIVYVGAVAILFLFAVMLVDIEYLKVSLKNRWIRISLLLFSASIMSSLGFLIVVEDSIFKSHSFENGSFQYSVSDIGYVLYTDYFYPFQLSGVLLLLSMVSVVSLTLVEKRKPSARYGDCGKQLAASKDVKNVKVGFRNGVRF